METLKKLIKNWNVFVEICNKNWDVKYLKIDTVYKNADDEILLTTEEIE